MSEAEAAQATTDAALSACVRCVLDRLCDLAGLVESNLPPSIPVPSEFSKAVDDVAHITLRFPCVCGGQPQFAKV